MTSEELKSLLADLKDSLETNRNFVTAPMLDKADELVAEYSNDPVIKKAVAVMFAIDEKKVDQMIEAIKKVLKTERQLITTDTTDKLLNGVENLQRHPTILRMVAAFL